MSRVWRPTSWACSGGQNKSAQRKRHVAGAEVQLSDWSLIRFWLGRTRTTGPAKPMTSHIAAQRQAPLSARRAVGFLLLGDLRHFVGERALSLGEASGWWRTRDCPDVVEDKVAGHDAQRALKNALKESEGFSNLEYRQLGP